MHITRFTDYTLRVLIQVAAQSPQPCTIAEVATHYNISRNHLMKVVQALSQRGYLTAQRGKNGGLQLPRPAAEINLGQLIRDCEQERPLVECFGSDNQCVITSACRLKSLLAEAQEAFFRVLDRYTLADLVGTAHRQALIELLQLPHHLDEHSLVYS